MDQQTGWAKVVLLAGLGIGLALPALGASTPKGSESVRKAQQALKDKGFDPGDIDGVMGPKTRAAIGEFQKSQDMKQTGLLDRTTADKLGVEPETVGGKFRGVGSGMASGGKGMAREIKHGKPVAAGKEFGKGVGQAAKSAGGGVKAAVSPKSTPKAEEKKPDQEPL